MRHDWRLNVTSCKAVGNSAHSLAVRNVGTAEEYTSGTVATPHGIVSVYYDVGEPAILVGGRPVRPPRASFTLYYGGRAYYLVDGTPRSYRGLVVMAGKFANFVAGK